MDCYSLAGEPPRTRVYSENNFYMKCFIEIVVSNLTFICDRNKWVFINIEIIYAES